MPSRGIVAAILLFWLGSTSLLITREILPRWRLGEAPPYNIDITDEVGAPQAEWEVLQGDRLIGRGLSQVRRREDRTFEMVQRIKFEGLELPVLVARVTVKKLETSYRVTRDGNLLGLQVKGWASFGDGGVPFELQAELSAEVKDGRLQPQLRIADQPVEVPWLRSVDVSEHGNVLNPMHLLNRLPRLQEGQRWKVPLLDPLKMFAAPQPLATTAIPYLEAEVDAATLAWNHLEVDCLRIRYREPGKEPIAATWVRRQDGLVLMQEARQHGREFTIRRLPAVR